jgi:hypothetical protein
VCVSGGHVWGGGSVAGQIPAGAQRGEGNRQRSRAPGSWRTAGQETARNPGANPPPPSPPARSLIQRGRDSTNPLGRESKAVAAHRGVWKSHAPFLSDKRHKARRVARRRMHDCLPASYWTNWDEMCARTTCFKELGLAGPWRPQGAAPCHQWS